MNTMPESSPAARVHKAAPMITDSERCAVCGQRIKKVPGGHGSTFIHKDSGAVAAPNPPLTADHIHVLLDVLSGELEPWTGYDAETDDAKASQSGWNQLRGEAKAVLEAILGGMSAEENEALSLSYAQAQCRAFGHHFLVPELPLDTEPQVMFQLAKERGQAIRADCQNGCGARKAYHADHSVNYEYPGTPRTSPPADHHQ